MRNRNQLPRVIQLRSLSRTHQVPNFGKIRVKRDEVELIPLFQGEGGSPPSPWLEATFWDLKVGFRLRIDLQLCSNRAQLSELCLEKLSALKMHHAVARYEAQKVSKTAKMTFFVSLS